MTNIFVLTDGEFFEAVLYEDHLFYKKRHELNIKKSLMEQFGKGFNPYIFKLENITFDLKELL